MRNPSQSRLHTSCHGSSCNGSSFVQRFEAAQSLSQRLGTPHTAGRRASERLAHDPAQWGAPPDALVVASPPPLTAEEFEAINVARAAVAVRRQQR